MNIIKLTGTIEISVELSDGTYTGTIRLDMDPKTLLFNPQELDPDYKPAMGDRVEIKAFRGLGNLVPIHVKKQA